MSNGWIPEDDEPQLGAEVVRGEHLSLQKVTMRFSVHLESAERAAAFELHFRLRFSRSAVTRRGPNDYIVFNCAAVGGEDATLQAAVAVETISRENVVQCPADAVHFVDVKQVGPVPPHELERYTRERDTALAQAIAWGMVPRNFREICEREARALVGQDQPSGPADLTPAHRRRLNA
jgi:hypothetical protein